MAKGFVPFVGMSNVLSEEKRQQVIALGRLGCPLRRIEQETGVRRETASVYLKAAGIGVRPPRGWGRRAPAKPANEVITGSTEESSDPNGNPKPQNPPEEGKSQSAKPANEVITTPKRGPSHDAISPAVVYRTTTERGPAV